MRTGNKPTAVPSPDQIGEALETLLESPFWPSSLSPDVRYARVHDDCEGHRDDAQQLAVLIGRDGDVHVLLPDFRSLRFREPMGGGVSPRVRNALLVLAEAIRRDNDTDAAHEASCS